MKAYQFLEKAKTFIDTPKKWTQGVFFKRETQQFCSYGALMELDAELCKSGTTRQEAREAELQSLRILEYVIGGSIMVFNDSHSHDEVMRMWDNAIVHARLKDI